MQLTQDGMKYYDRMIDKFEKFESDYRKNLSEKQKEKSFYTKSEIFHDNNYELTTNWLTNTSSREECLELLKKELDEYYLT